MKEPTTNIERNWKQWEFVQTIINNKADFRKKGDGGWQRGFSATLQAGRGTGKTISLFDIMSNSASNLPGACLMLAGRTYTQIQTIILQQMPFVFRQWGLKEYDKKENPLGQYVVFTKPPKHWASPHFPTREFSNAISFINGAYVQLASADRPEVQRGTNIDQLYIDESGSCKEDFIKTVSPGLRANLLRYRDSRRKGYNHPLHWGKFDFTSAPRHPYGEWIYKNEERMKKDPEGYYFLQGNAYDNTAFLPGNYIDNLRDEMTDLDFRIEVLNERVTRVGNAFYSALNIDEHGYLDNKYEQKGKVFIESDNKYNVFKELIVGFDFNSYFTSLLVAQYQEGDKEFRIIDCQFVKQSTTTLVDELINKFINTYSNHIRKVVRIRGDQSGKRKSENTHASSYDIIKSKLRLAGWEVIDEVQSTYPSMNDRYIIANSMLTHENPKLPKIKIHEVKCKSLLIAMQLAPVDGGTFEKDKSSENPKSSVPQEHATHLTDIFDYLICKSFQSKVLQYSTRLFDIDIKV